MCVGESGADDALRQPVLGTSLSLSMFMRHRLCSMVMHSVADELIALHARICKGIADPKRLLIINALRNGEQSVMELCDGLHLPQANVSQHLAVLRDRGLVSTRRDAQRVFYSLTSMKIIEAIDLLREVMAEQMDSSSERRVASSE
jgi:ArsR family transcriptional regulator